MNPEVAIVVLNWNSYEDTSAALDSLSKVKYPSYNIYVVDNDSSDRSGQLLASNYSEHTFIFNEENLGFAGGANTGIKRAMSDGSDYVLLLNNDIIVSDDFLAPLVETAESNDRVAAVSGIITRSDTGDIWYAGGRVLPCLGKAKKSYKIYSEQEYEVGFVTGALVLLSPDYLEQYGMLNDAYFFGMEDKELSYEILDNNWKIMVNPRSRVRHHVSSSSGEGNSFNYYHQIRNKLEFSKSQLSRVQQLIFYPYLIISRLIRIPHWIILGKPQLVMANLSAIYDHIKGNEFKKWEYFNEPD